MSQSDSRPRFDVEFHDPMEHADGAYTAAKLTIGEYMHGLALVIEAEDGNVLCEINIEDAVGAYLAGTLASSSGVTFG